MHEVCIWAHRGGPQSLLVGLYGSRVHLQTFLFVCPLSTSTVAAPGRSVGIVVAPSAGPLGMQSTDDGARKADDDVQIGLGDSLLTCVYSKLNICLVPVTILKESRRPGWIVFSVQSFEVGDVDLKSLV